MKSTFIAALKARPLVLPEDKGSVLTRWEYVEYGVLHIIQGALMIAVGGRAGGPVLPYIMAKATQKTPIK